jgi:dUTP pyrophosphatase
MFENLVQKIRERLVQEIIKGFSEQLTGELIQQARNTMSQLVCEAEFEIDTERVGAGVTSQVNLPTVGSSAAQAFDLYTPIDILIPGLSSVNVPIGRKIKLPTGYGAVLWSRSGMAAKLLIERGAGLIDYDYGDEWIVVLRNHGPNTQAFKAGDRICQVFLLPRYKYKFNEVDKVVVDNDRGGGIGSTGS